ncbi:MAG: LytTR family transcriptional regulator DNA-binding domain-containing protein [Ruminococcus sp.]|jgi:DNA-binding LytR/AlgR family response regulator|nr:LytTR family transcriptional regulator DNA-binding domain-containing protein [Ruminococcus sp.]
MFRIAICDDDKDDIISNRTIIEQDLLGRGITDFEIICFDDPEELIESSILFSLIFLDIEMPGRNGIDTAIKIREKGISTPFVYVTNYTSFALVAYSVFPLSLVTKPLTSDIVKNVMDEYFRRHDNAKPKLIEVKSAGGALMLLPSDIIYFNCVAKKDIIAVTNSSMITLTEKFDTLYERVSEFNFFRIRRDIIVNLGHVKAITDDGKVKMSNDTILPVAHREKNEFYAALSKKVIVELGGR